MLKVVFSEAIINKFHISIIIILQHQKSLKQIYKIMDESGMGSITFHSNFSVVPSVFSSSGIFSISS